MDSFEQLFSNLNQSSKSKSNSKKDKNSSKKQKIKEIFIENSPPSPVFKPQESPKDLLPEFSLPLSDLSTDDNNDDLSVPQQFKKSMSCPADAELNIWVDDKSHDIGEFQLIDENNGDSCFLEGDTLSVGDKATKKEAPITLIENKSKIPGSPQLSTQSSQGKGTNDGRRFRSLSENITACTIFNFLEKKKLANS